MVQMLINLGKWLEARFPKKVVVLEQDYQQLKQRLEAIESRDVSALESRIKVIEINAVHKEPVEQLIKAMAQMKAEIVSLRAGLGITATGASSPEALEAMLNGEMINGGHNG